jgi:hypothetical protein
MEFRKRATDSSAARRTSGGVTEACHNNGQVGRRQPAHWNLLNMVYRRFFETWTRPPPVGDDFRTNCSLSIPIRSVSEARRTRLGSARCRRGPSKRRGQGQVATHWACACRGMRRTSLTLRVGVGVDGRFFAMQTRPHQAKRPGAGRDPLGLCMSRHDANLAHASGWCGG